MSITNELRSWAEGDALRAGMSLRTARDQALAIADRIDAEHERAVMSAMNDALYHANDESMAELGWVRLPKDADGEYIRIGDELCDDWNEQNQGEVECLMLDHHGWWFRLKNSCERFYANEFHEWHHRHHHHAQTVEDVLREFALKVAGEECMTMRTGVVEEYAAKLRLAKEEDA